MGTVIVPARVKELLQFTFEEGTYSEIELHVRHRGENQTYQTLEPSNVM